MQAAGVRSERCRSCKFWRHIVRVFGISQMCGGKCLDPHAQPPFSVRDSHVTPRQMHSLELQAARREARSIS
jgi:hypothetical protein